MYRWARFVRWAAAKDLGSAHFAKQHNTALREPRIAFDAAAIVGHLARFDGLKGNAPTSFQARSKVAFRAGQAGH